MGFFGMAFSYLLFSVLHFFQFIMGLVVIGLYGVDLDNARKAGKYTDGKWGDSSDMVDREVAMVASSGSYADSALQVFAVIVGALSSLTALLYMVPFILRFAVIPAWSLVIFILWCAVLGIFGNMYIHENPEGNAGITRMKNAVWVDLTNLILWLLGTIAGAAYWWAHRERHSRFTGRANLGRNASTRSSGWRK